MATNDPYTDIGDEETRPIIRESPVDARHVKRLKIVTFVAILVAVASLTFGIVMIFTKE